MTSCEGESRGSPGKQPATAQVCNESIPPTTDLGEPVDSERGEGRRRSTPPSPPEAGRQSSLDPSLCSPVPVAVGASALAPSERSEQGADAEQDGLRGTPPACPEPEGLRSRVPGGVQKSPRYVTPGIETQRHPDEGVYVGLDWIRCTAPEEIRDPVERYLREAFGREPKQSHGAKWFKAGLVWDPGVLMSWQHKSRIVQVDIQGERLRLLDAADRIRVLRTLITLGMRPTRVDGALDYVGQNAGICVAAEDSCRRKELCGLRKFSPNNEYTADGSPTRLHLKIGSRSSPVCARIYDKGLEQGLDQPGLWERIETEWKEDRARCVGAMLLAAGDDWDAELAGLILGAFEFRERNGRSEVSRRPVCGWWAELTAGVRTIRAAPAAPPASFERWVEWFRGSVAPRLHELADAGRTSVADLVERFCEGVEPSRNGGPVVEEFLAIYKPLDARTSS